MFIRIEPPPGNKFDFDLYAQISEAFDNVKSKDNIVIVETENLRRLKKLLPTGYIAKEIKPQSAKRILLNEAKHAFQDVNDARRKQSKSQRTSEKIATASKSVDLLIAFHKASSHNFNRFAEIFSNNVKIFGAVSIAIPLLCGTIWMGYQISNVLSTMTPRRQQNIQDIEEQLGYTPKSRVWTKTDNQQPEEIVLNNE